MAKQLSHWFDSVIHSVQHGLNQTCWHPAVDIYETADGWMLKVDVAGVELKDINVSVSGQDVTIRGCRRDHLAESGLAHLSLEISYSCFARTMSLPQPIDAQRVDAQMVNGLLVITLWRKEV